MMYFKESNYNFYYFYFTFLENTKIDVTIIINE